MALKWSALTEAELVAFPLAWNPTDIGRFMPFFGPVAILLAYALLTTAMKTLYARRFGWQ